MSEFTSAEIDRINLIAAGEVENLTLDDLELYSKWRTNNALREERFRVECENMTRESNARVEQAQQVANAAAENLNAQRDLALARLKAVDDGQI